MNHKFFTVMVLCEMYMCTNKVILGASEELQRAHCPPELYLYLQDRQFSEPKRNLRDQLRALPGKICSVLKYSVSHILCRIFIALTIYK